LAFSAGVDSSALFHILKANGIDFDLAMVDYGVREQSTHEVQHAKHLANTHHKHLHLYNAPPIPKNFEKVARDMRYDFFERTIKEHRYENLITAHQLDDRFEWMLMQLARGAGAVELVGFYEQSPRQNYTLLRPLIHLSKEELLSFLEINHLKYYIDASNNDTLYTRNHIRHSFSTAFLKAHKEGIKKSFNYLEKDIEILNDYHIEQFADLYKIYLSQHTITNLRAIDFIYKRLGYVLSSSQKEEIMQQKDIVIHDFVIYIDASYIFIAPYVQDTMDKDFKELCRKKQISPKLRPYLFKVLKNQVNTIFSYK